jgi:hypothetical protein
MLRELDEIRSRLDGDAKPKGEGRAQLTADIRRAFLLQYSRNFPDAVRVEEMTIYASIRYHNDLIERYQAALFLQPDHPDRIVAQTDLMNTVLAAKLNSLVLAKDLDDFEYKVRNFERLTLEVRQLPERLGPWLRYEKSKDSDTAAAQALRERDQKIAERIKKAKERVRVLDDALQSIYKLGPAVLKQRAAEARRNREAAGNQEQRRGRGGLWGWFGETSGRAATSHIDTTSVPASIPFRVLNDATKKLLGHRFDANSEIPVRLLTEVIREEQRHHFERLSRLLRLARRRSAEHRLP